MDPSYSPYTGSQFGATPGAGGFSGAQPGAGFGSGAGAGMQPGFGSGAGSSISSGTGDIVLSKTGGKSKKPLIIGLIVFVLLAIAGAVAAVVVMNMNKSNTINSYRRFANYVLYGNESNAALAGTYDTNYKYAAQVALNSRDEEKMAGFYNRAATLWEDFGKHYSVTNETRDVFNIISDNLSFLKVFSSTQLPNIARLKESYAESGRDGALSIMDDYLSNFYNMSSSVFDGYLNFAQFYTDGAIAVVDFETKTGLGNTMKTMEFAQAKNNLLSYVDELNAELIQACFNLNAKVGGGK